MPDSSPSEDQIRATPRPEPRRRLSLKATLTGVVLMTVTVTAALVHFPWLWTSKKNVDSLAAQLNEEIMRGTSQEVEKIFDNVLSAKHLIADLFDQQLIDPYNPEQQANLYLSLLRANNNFTWVQLGYANGDYLGVQRRIDGLFNVIRRQWDDPLGRLAEPGTPLAQKQAERAVYVEEYLNTGHWEEALTPATKTIDTYRHEGSDWEKVGERQIAEVYYSPVRPFYEVAADRPGEDAWTDLHVFVTGKAVGIEASITYDAKPIQGPFLGVISIAFELRQISDYLAHLDLAETGAVFIINEQAQLIAFSNPEKLAETFVGEEKPQLKRLDEIDAYSLGVAHRSLTEQKVQLDQINNLQEFIYHDPESGQDYYVALKPLDRFGWLVGTVTPKAIFLTDINRNKQILLGLVFFLVAVGSVGAVVLSDRAIARPILMITDAAAAIEAGEFATESLDRPARRTDELGKLARVFQDMARQIHVREQRLKRQVQELRIEIDDTKRKKAVREIAETDFFLDLQSKAQDIRQRRRRKSSSKDAPNA
ncbi:MAG: HAMP domain-containing protein [Spirulina sp. SIO3F2]|nr:HAMP domain-containing protein [Spirulina sp. SIO3F2]